MSRVRSGFDPVSNPGTWEVLYAVGVRFLPHALALLGVAERDLEDVLQDVLFAAYLGIDRFDPLQSGCAVEAQARAMRARPDTSRWPSAPEEIAARVWLFGIAWRRVRHHLERAYRRRERPMGLVLGGRFDRADTTPGPEQRIANDERLALTVGLLAAVAPERRAVLVLKDAFEVPMGEIAAALRLNERTAWNRLRIARAEYRAAVRRMNAEHRKALGGVARALPFAPVGLLRAVTEGSPPRGLPSPEVDVPPRGAPSLDPAGAARRGLASARRAGAWLWGPAHHVAIGLASVCALALVQLDAGVWQRSLAAVVRGPAITAAAGIGAAGAGALGAEELPVEGGSAGVGSLDDGEPSAGGPAPRPGTTGAAVSSPRIRVPAARPHDSLEAEQRLLAQVREPLEQGDVQAALERLAAHERQFLSGKLAELREHLRGRVLKMAASEGRRGLDRGAGPRTGAAGTPERETP